MKFSVVIFVSVFLFATRSIFATTVLPVSLQEMSKSAEYIFHGRAVSNEVKVDDVSKNVVTITTFNIIEGIKGSAGRSLAIKQIGGQLPGSNVAYVTHGIPQFTVGQEYVVFVPQKSRLGFSSPIGLGQGVISVSRENGVATVNRSPSDADGNVRVSEQLRHAGSDAVPHQQAPTAIPQSAPVQPAGTPLADFIKTIRHLAGVK